MAKRPIKRPKRRVNKDVKDLCKRIDELRLKKHLSVRKFATDCGISNSQVIEIGNEGIDFRYSTLLKISTGLEITVSELLNF